MPGRGTEGTVGTGRPVGELGTGGKMPLGTGTLGDGTTGTGPDGEGAPGAETAGG